MSADHVLSVQFLKCTDESRRKIDCVLTQKKELPPQTRGLLRPAHPSRLSHRTLYPLRKAGVQVHPGPWPWPQVLPVRQLSQSTAAAGLYPSAVAQSRRAVIGQLPENEDSPRKYLRHQSRTPSKTRGALTVGWLCPHRCRSCRNPARQYAAKLLSDGKGLRDRFTGGRQ